MKIRCGKSDSQAYSQSLHSWKVKRCRVQTTQVDTGELSLASSGRKHVEQILKIISRTRLINPDESQVYEKIWGIEQDKFVFCYADLGPTNIKIQVNEDGKAVVLNWSPRLGKCRIFSKKVDF